MTANIELVDEETKKNDEDYKGICVYNTNNIELVEVVQGSKVLTEQELAQEFAY